MGHKEAGGPAEGQRRAGKGGINGPGSRGGGTHGQRWRERGNVSPTGTLRRQRERTLSSGVCLACNIRGRAGVIA